MSLTLLALVAVGVFPMAGRRKPTAPKISEGPAVPAGSAIAPRTPQAPPPAVGPVYAPDDPAPTMTSGPGRTIPPPAPPAPGLKEADRGEMVCVWEIVVTPGGFGQLQRRCFYPDTP